MSGISDLPNSQLDKRAIETLAGACNSDARFRRWGAGFTGTVSIGCDDQAAWISIDRGSVVANGMGPVAEPVIRIDGSGDVWRSICEGLPGGLHRAWRQGQLEFGGDTVALLKNYRMFWHLGELMVREWGGR